MKGIPDWIREAALELGITLVEMPVEEADSFRRVVADRYAGGRQHWLWERYNPEERVSIRDAGAWSWVAEFIAGREAILFFNSSDSRVIFVFADGQDLGTILAETPGYEFYMTDRAATYLLSYNHHDYLSALGMAMPWLETKIKRGPV